MTIGLGGLMSHHHQLSVHQGEREAYHPHRQGDRETPYAQVASKEVEEEINVDQVDDISIKEEDEVSVFDNFSE